MNLRRMNLTRIKLFSGVGLAVLAGGLIVYSIVQQNSNHAKKLHDTQSKELKQALDLEGHGRCPEAVPILRKLSAQTLKLKKDQAKVHTRLGDCLADAKTAKDLDEAITNLNKALGIYKELKDNDKQKEVNLLLERAKTNKDNLSILKTPMPKSDGSQTQGVQNAVRAIEL